MVNIFQIADNVSNSVVFAVNSSGVLIGNGFGLTSVSGDSIVSGMAQVNGYIITFSNGLVNNIDQLDGGFY